MASLLGLPIGLGGAALMRVSNPGRDLYAVDFVVISLLTTLVLVALLGLLARPQTRSGTMHTLARPRPFRALRRRWSRTRRYTQIVLIGARYAVSTRSRRSGRPPDEPTRTGSKSGRNSSLDLAAALQQAGARVEPRELNGNPGAILRDRNDKVVGTLTLDVLGGRIQTIRSVVNPDKFGHVGLLAAPRPGPALAESHPVGACGHDPGKAAPAPACPPARQGRQDRRSRPVHWSGQTQTQGGPQGVPRAPGGSRPTLGRPSSPGRKQPGACA